MNSDWEQPAANFRFTTTAKFLAHEAYSIVAMLLLLLRRSKRRSAFSEPACGYGCVARITQATISNIAADIGIKYQSP